MEKKENVVQKTTGPDGNRHYTTSTKPKSAESQAKKPPQSSGSGGNRDVKYKHNYSNSNKSQQQPRYKMDRLSKGEETAEDIRNDIERIEKEIEIEIKEIKNMRLGI